MLCGLLFLPLGCGALKGVEAPLFRWNLGCWVSLQNLSCLPVGAGPALFASLPFVPVLMWLLLWILGSKTSVQLIIQVDLHFQDFIYLFLERGEGMTRRETLMCERNIDELPTWDLAHNPGMCPDQETNQWPFGSQTSAPSIEPWARALFYILAVIPVWPWEEVSVTSTYFPGHFPTDGLYPDPSCSWDPPDTPLQCL